MLAPWGRQINLPAEDVPLPRATRAEKQRGPAARLPLGAPQMPLNPNTHPPQPRRPLPPLPTQQPNINTGAQPRRQPTHGVLPPTPDRPYPTPPPAYGSLADSGRGAEVEGRRGAGPAVVRSGAAKLAVPVEDAPLPQASKGGCIGTGDQRRALPPPTTAPASPLLSTPRRSSDHPRPTPRDPAPGESVVSAGMDRLNSSCTGCSPT